MKKVNMKNFKGGPGNFFIIAILMLGIFLALLKLTRFTRTTENINYSRFLREVEQNNIENVTVMGSDITGAKRNGIRFETVIPQDAKIWDTLKNHHVDVTIVSPTAEFSFWHTLLLLSFVAIPIAIWFFLRQSRGGSSGGAGNIFGMSKSKAKMFMPSQIKVNFDAVAGAHEAKEELFDVVDFLRNPEKYRRLGAKLTRGVLLVGEPGNGKTLLAKAVAGEANCPFFSVSGSDFIEVFVGVGAARVRDLFSQARRHAPSILFIDEIDAVGRHRGSGLGGGHDEREQTLNQLLTEMDGFDSSSSSIVVIAATNRPDVLDKALLRPGRFDCRVDVPYPDVRSREAILKIHSKGVKFEPTIDWSKIAHATPGFTGSHLANLINQAAINASKLNKDKVTVHDLEEARDKIMLGKQNVSIIMSPQEREITAWHEAGHALVVLLMPEHLDPLHKVTILPRGGALGITYSLQEEKYSCSKEEALARICRSLGGRIAEELKFNRITTGASSDFQSASRIARSMVCYYGMSAALGTVVYDESNGHDYSEDTARQIDNEVRTIMQQCYDQTKQLLQTNRDKLDSIAQLLLEKELVDAAELYQVLNIPPRELHTMR